MMVARSFVVIGKVLKMKIPITLVKRGGYDSREEMLDDLMPKLKKLYEKKNKKKQLGIKSMSEQKNDRTFLASRLKEMREYLALSQEEVAQMLKIPRSAISLIENGERGVEAVELKQFAEVYKCSIGLPDRHVGHGQKNHPERD